MKQKTSKSPSYPPLIKGGSKIFFKRRGFTLVEIVIVVMAIGLIMVSIIGVTLKVFRSHNMAESTNKVVQNGSFILNELRRNVLNSSQTEISCPTGVGSSIAMINLYDGEKTTIVCGQKIASISATRIGETIFLSGVEVAVTDCNTFVSCSTLSPTEVSAVSFRFGLNSQTSGVGASQIFDIDVTVRN